MLKPTLILSLLFATSSATAQSATWQFFAPSGSSDVSLAAPIAWENGVLRTSNNLFVGRLDIGAAQLTTIAPAPSNKPQLLLMDGRWYQLFGSPTQALNAPLHVLGAGSFSNCRNANGPLESNPTPPRIDIGASPSFPIPLASSCNGFNDSACIGIRYQDNADVLVLNSRNGGVICDGEMAAPLSEIFMRSGFEDTDIIPGALANENTITINPASGEAFVKTTFTQAAAVLRASNQAFTNQVLMLDWFTFGFIGPVNCSATSANVGWSGPLTQSPNTLTMPSTPGPLSLGLSCSGINANGASKVETVNADINVISRPCPTPGYLGAPYNISILPFQTAFAAPFPAYNNQFGNQHLLSFQAYALEFVVPTNTGADGLFQMALTTGGGGSGVPITSISKCPGEFSESLNVNGRTCFKLSGEDGPEWTISNQLPFSGTRCLLIPGERYYLNLGFDACTAQGSQTCSFRAFSRSSSQ
jgi:hypothetical protein